MRNPDFHDLPPGTAESRLEDGLTVFDAATESLQLGDELYDEGRWRKIDSVVRSNRKIGSGTVIKVGFSDGSVSEILHREVQTFRRKLSLRERLLRLLRKFAALFRLRSQD